MNHFVEVTELGGDEVTEEQVQRIFHRYVWSSTFSKQKDVLEVGCGTGQGLGYLLESSKTVEAGDYSEPAHHFSATTAKMQGLNQPRMVN